MEVYREMRILEILNRLSNRKRETENYESIKAVADDG